MLDVISLAQISCLTYSDLHAWKLLSPMVYFSLRNDVSICPTGKNIVSGHALEEILPLGGS